jgi:(p)ppGpp synthase/HD superfamily hydrolase
MEIVIRELPNPNLNKIVIALLHDIVELFPEYAPIIRRIYGDYIADGIDALSKKKFETYMAAEEMDEYTTTQDDERKGELGKIGKDRRNEDYF